MKQNNAIQFKSKIIEEYQKGRSLKFLATKYKTSKESVVEILKSCNIQIRTKHQRISNAFFSQKEIVEDYQNGISQVDLVKKYRCSPKVIKEIFKLNGVIERPLGFQVRKERGTKSGYITIPKPDNYPKGNSNGSKLYYEHVLNYEKYIDRILDPATESIHHIDLDKTNNEIQNLHLCKKTEHIQIHNQLNQIVTEFIKKNLIQFDPINSQYLINPVWLEKL